jgi:hypothetical protein
MATDQVATAGCAVSQILRPRTRSAGLTPASPWCRSGAGTNTRPVARHTATRVEAREHDDPNTGIELLDPANALDPIDPREADVHQHDVGRRVPDGFERLLDGGGDPGEGKIRLDVDNDTERVPEGPVVVHDEDGGDRRALRVVCRFQPPCSSKLVSFADSVRAGARRSPSMPMNMAKFGAGVVGAYDPRRLGTSASGRVA